MSVITCRHGESITTSLTNAPDGIEASLVVNVLAPDGETIVWTTTGVTDAGTGLYTQVIPVTWDTTGHAETNGTITYIIQWVYGVTSATDTLDVIPLDAVLTARDEVRLRIGDTDANARILTDDQVDAFVTERAGNVLLAAADACDAIAAQYSIRFEFSTDNQSFKPNQVAENYRKMAERYRARGEGASTVAGTRVDGYSSTIPNDQVDTSSSNRLVQGVGVFGYRDRTP